MKFLTQASFLFVLLCLLGVSFVHFQAIGSAQEQNPSSNAALIEAAELTKKVVELFNQSRFEEALPLAKRALELREKNLGPDHELVQAAILNVAEICKVTKRYAEARKFFERLLTTYERKFGNDDAGVAAMLDKVAVVAFLQGDFDQSEKNYQRALSVRESVFGKNSQEVAASLFSLAEFYRFTGKFERAAGVYEDSLQLRSKLLGPGDSEFQRMRERYRCLPYELPTERMRQRVNEFASRLPKADWESAGAVAGEVLNGRAISLPQPPYPGEALRDHFGGIVVVKITIDEQGNVIEAKDMCGGNPVLVKPSLAAARKARFMPTTINGKPVKVSGAVTYLFVARH
jgi:TonB family protein